MKKIEIIIDYIVLNKLLQKSSLELKERETLSRIIPSIIESIISATKRKYRINTKCGYGNLFSCRSSCRTE
jgi:hypothetical protein